jgi:hypothetical protein
MNRCTFQLRNKLVVVVKLWKSVIIQHVWELIAGNYVLISEKQTGGFFMCQGAPYIHFRTIPFMFQMLSGGLTAANDTVIRIDTPGDVKFCLVGKGNTT